MATASSAKPGVLGSMRDGVLALKIVLTGRTIRSQRRPSLDRTEPRALLIGKAEPDRY